MSARKKSATVRIDVDISEVKPREVQACLTQIKATAKALAFLDDQLAALRARVEQLEQPSLPIGGALP